MRRRRVLWVCLVRSFNSRTPGGVRPYDFHKVQSYLAFQFTHPGRGATRPTSRAYCRRRSFNSRTPGGVRPSPRELSAECLEFQFTHPGRGATVLADEVVAHTSFQFTHPGRGATYTKNLGDYEVSVSIHAPREGCDSSRVATATLIQRFNSRTPGGVRRFTINYQ